LPGRLGYPLRYFVPHAAGAATGGLSAGKIILILVGIAVALAIVVTGPVAGELAFDMLSKVIAKIAPATFVIGLAALLTGLVIHVGALDIVGISLIGGLLLAAIAKHY
jgi:hypothetical protein